MNYGFDALDFGLIVAALSVVKLATWILKQALPSKSVLTQEEYQMLKDLHTLHDVKDRDGTPVWYVRGSLERSIQSLAAQIARLGGVLTKMEANCGANTKALEKILNGKK